MSVIGKQIRRFRLQKGYTQEQLSREVGVTTQAVSKWERGSTPDAEILPLIADVLGVDINSLFGREEQELQLMMDKKLSSMPEEEAFRYASQFCGSIILGLTGDEHFTEDFADTFVSHSVIKKDSCRDYFAKLVRDRGMAFARISNDFSHFFLLVEPHEESVQTHLESVDALRKVFALFSDKKLLKTVCYLCSVSNIPVALPLIVKETGLNADEAERCVKILCEHQLATRMKIAVGDGEIDTYAIRIGTGIIPLLCFADEIAKGCPPPIFRLCEREKPLL